MIRGPLSNSTRFSHKKCRHQWLS